MFMLHVDNHSLDTDFKHKTKMPKKYEVVLLTASNESLRRALSTRGQKKVCSSC